ncbi:MAG: hypothetical protein IPM80_12975 [Proteobacteria bacterium]|nr:hypothetical protein [Pseudomonadota bacterium]
MAAEASHALSGIPAAEPVHVFGTDQAGRHDLPGAAFAARAHGAAIGVANGPSGNAYAIPFRGVECQLLPLKMLGVYIKELIEYAAARKDQTFQIMRFACGTNAYDDAQLAVLFATAPGNCLLPGVWQRCLDRKMPARLLLFDPTARLREPEWRERVKRYLALNQPLWNVPSVELVSFGAARSVVANDALARSLGLKHRIMGANEDYYGRDGTLAAEAKAVWYATHFLSLCDFDQTAQPNQIRITGTAVSGGLHIDQLNVNADD